MARRRLSAQGQGRERLEHNPGPPTVVSVEGDYGYTSVLCDRSPGVSGVLELDPDEPGLFLDIGRRMRTWLDEHAALECHWIAGGPETEASRRDEARSARDLRTLAHDIQQELGPDVAVFLGGVPVGELRGP